jgi:hypothetical protein
MLLVTVDCDDILSCSEPKQLTTISDAVIAARPDIYSIDVADNDVCHYPTTAGTTLRGIPMDALLDAGLDPYGIVVKAIKEASITFVANYRVNDHHGSPISWTEWERQHKAWSLGKETGIWPTYKIPGDRGWRELGDLRQMDYAIEGVRQRRLGILSEAVARYPVDGLQLDFGRSAPFLSEPKREKAKYMTEFVRSVRAMLDAVGRQRGKALTLSGALPWDIEYCEAEGLDVRAWIKEGLLSYVAPGEWIWVDYNMPYAPWMTAAKGTGCKVYPMTMSDMAPDPADKEADRLPYGDARPTFGEPEIRALAENAYSQGATGIMFYNLYVRLYGTSHYPFLRDWIDPNKIAAATRHYYYARRLKYLPTEYYSFGMPDGYAPGTIEGFTPFPLDVVGDGMTCDFLFGCKLGKTRAAFQFKAKNLGDADRLDVTLNGQKIASDAVLFREDHQAEAPAFRYGVWQATVGTPPLKEGANVVSVKLVQRDAGRQAPIKAGEFELLVGAASA